MKHRLSKIARDLNTSISAVTDFLRENGFDYDEDPNVRLSAQATEIIENNFAAFITEREGRPQQQIGKGERDALKKPAEVPLELRIIEAADKEKKLIERIIGFTEFDWQFVVARYQGECSMPIQFTLFDEVICELLLIEQMSATKIGHILGFEIEKDPAEKEILFAALDELRKDKMLEGDESALRLTQTGKEYAINGVKFSTFKREFELYFDLVGDVKENARNIFSSLKSARTSVDISNLPEDIEDIRQLAELQAPEIHYPPKDFLLQSVELLDKEKASFKAKVWVVLLENFRDNSLRAIVYDEKQNAVIDALSKAIDKKEDIKNELLEHVVSIDDQVEFTKEEKPEDQIKIEKTLIQWQDEIDEAIETQNIEKVKEIQRKNKFLKRHFNSLEFEIELKRLFDETANELWLISPWVKKAIFNRISFFENYLKKGGKLFVAYSHAEIPEKEKEMADKESLDSLLALERKYQNFFLHQLPAFHYKNVWLRKEDGHLYYNGSFNILSFFVRSEQKKVRQEKMTRFEWDEEVQKEYSDTLKQFSLKYINQAIGDFKLLCQHPPSKINRSFLQQLKTIDNSKLKPFINQGIEPFNIAYKALEASKTEELNKYRKKFFESSIEDFKKQVEHLSKKPIAPERKRDIQNDFEKLRDEFIEFMELQRTTAKDVANTIDNLRTFQVQKSNKKRK